MTSIAEKIVDSDYRRIASFIEAETGLIFPESKKRFLLKVVCDASRNLGYPNPSVLIGQIGNKKLSRQALDTLIAHLTVGETYFFRDKAFFQVLKDDIFRGLIYHPRRPDKSIRVWSAGCASGEEPYSIAMLMEEMSYRISGIPMTIIGSDINPFFLEKARKGLYTHWSFRETPKTILNRYFEKKDENHFEIKPGIREMVRFVRLNLAKEKDYGMVLRFNDPFDLVICRNVLMYFSPSIRQKVVDKLIRILDRNGWLVVGPAETAFIDSPEMTPVRFKNTIFFRKGPPRRTERNYIEPIQPGYNQHQALARRTPAGLPASISPPVVPFRRKTDRVTKKDSLEILKEAQAAYNKGDYRNSSSLLLELVKRDASRNDDLLIATSGMLLLVRSYANMGEMDEASFWCKEALKAEPLNPEAHFLSAIIAQEEGRMEEAAQALKRAIYLDPDFIMAHFSLALQMKNTGRAKAAEKYLSTVKSLLAEMDPEQTVPFSEGLTAKRLSEMVTRLLA